MVTEILYGENAIFVSRMVIWPTRWPSYLHIDSVTVLLQSAGPTVGRIKCDKRAPTYLGSLQRNRGAQNLHAYLGTEAGLRLVSIIIKCHLILYCLILSNLNNCLILPKRDNPMFKERRIIGWVFFFHTVYLYIGNTVFSC